MTENEEPLEVGSIVHLIAKVVDFDSNPNGVAIQVELNQIKPRCENTIWIHRTDIPFVIEELKNWVPLGLTLEGIQKRKKDFEDGNK